MSTDALNPKRRRACVYCNKKKIRCNFTNDQETCNACAALNIGCAPRLRKKRRLKAAQPLVPSPPSRDRPQLLDSPQSLFGRSWESDSDKVGLADSQLAPQPPLAVSHRVGMQSLSPPGGAATVLWPGFEGNSNTTTQQTPYHNSTNSEYDVTNSRQQHSDVAINFDVAETNESDHRIISDDQQHDARPQAWVDDEAETYIGRSHYITQDTPIDESSARSYHASKRGELSDVELKTVELWGSFELPSRSARQSLIDTFMQNCYPWTPILDPSDLETRNDKPPSLLLLQSLFLAASRVSSSPGVLAFASSEQFYQRAKALFWSNHEKNPIIAIKATLMLQWLNPDGPAHFSCDNSEFWLKIGVGLAYQVGLHKEPPSQAKRLTRRRLWWSLVARDCLISAAHGRPRAINLDDCEIPPPSLEDFPDAKAQGEIFIPHVEICRLLGDLTEHCSRKHISNAKRLHLESALYRWTRTLPDSLRLAWKRDGSDIYTMSTYCFNARQLHLPYFICLVILSRLSATVRGTLLPVATLASSFAASIMEDFLTRDEVRFLAPVFTFYCFAAGAALVSLRSYPDLWVAAQPDFEIFKNCLKELSNRWKSAVGALKALQNVTGAIQENKASMTQHALTWLNSNEELLFEGFPLDLCRMWTSYEERTKAYQTGSSELLTPENLGFHFPTPLDQISVSMGPFGCLVGQGDSSFTSFPFEGMGNWLANDWEMTDRSNLDYV